MDRHSKQKCSNKSDSGSEQLDIWQLEGYCCKNLWVSNQYRTDCYKDDSAISLEADGRMFIGILSNPLVFCPWCGVR